VRGAAGNRCPYRDDEKAIRAQSAILYKNNPQAVIAFILTAFSVRMLLIRTENAVGARSAQVYSVDFALRLE
jgi:hypothetical protein